MSQVSEMAEEENGTQAEEEEEIMVGSLLVNVVGLKYYHGTVTDGEMVQLVREPSNAYDPNAIRVLNIRGHQVGHVERGKAAHLAPLVDGGLALLEGLVPSGSRSIHRMPCEVFVFSLPALAGAVLDHLEIAGERLKGPHDPREEVGRGGRGGRGGEAGGARRGSTKRKLPEVGASSEAKKPSIDDIFELMKQAKKRQSIEADEKYISSSLMQHQKEALAWMVQRENTSALPPFWELQASTGNRRTMYRNTLTNYTCDARPDPLRGGILADDMGLGKTLTVLALVATNRPGATLPPIVDIAGEVEEEEDAEQKTKKKRKDNRKGKAQQDATSDGPSCVPTAGGPRATLVVCPLSVLSNWVGQLEDHTKTGSFKVQVFHGPERAKSADALASCDMVFTTYNMLASEFKNKSSPLIKVHWLRVVLDEAHLVKNPKSLQAKCASSLKADRRWAVTGTPIQNNAKDLFSLMQFLHFEPLNEQTFWNRTIQRPLTSGQEAGFTRLQGLMSAISLRRTKKTKIDGKMIVDLPPKIVSTFPVDLSPEDREVYDKMERDSKKLVEKYLATGTVTKNLAFVLHIILRLRQLCDHSSMCPADILEALAAMSSSDDISIASPELLQKMLSMMGDDFDCPICLSPPVTAIITRCAHVFCRKCIEKTFDHDKKQCPMCRANLSSADVFTSNAPEEEKKAEDVTKGVKGSSAKISAVISLLEKSRAKDPSIKSVIFSQFAAMLNLMEGPLTEAGFKFVKLQGGMTAKKREQAMEAFKSTASDSPTVFLLSLKAAGVGLNLVSASNVYLLDPWWNPAVEEQAMDRVHRLGQTRDVHVFRMIVRDSIEERMLKMQEKKRAYAQIAMGKEASEKRRQQCIEDVRILLSC